MTNTNSAPANDPMGEPVVFNPDLWPELPVKPTHFRGSGILDTARVAHDATLIADEIIAHLAGLAGAKVVVTLEITAEVAGGIPATLVRVLHENSETLKFSDRSFDAKS